MNEIRSKRPRIGITLEIEAPDEDRRVLELPADYPAAVIRAGGLPVLLPFTHDVAVRREMIELVDGLLVPGGNDLDPRLYGQALHPKTKLLNPDRTDFDFALLSLAEQRRLPTLGVCLGCQMMNVHRRGTLHQHLPEAALSSPEVASGRPLQHSRVGDRLNAHEIVLRRGTVLADALKLETLAANSRHHQGIDKLGHGLLSAAASPDGLIEAIEDPTLPFWVAVQWHPENLADSPHDRLFVALVEAARAYRERGG